MPAFIEQVRELAAKRQRFATLAARVKATREQFEATLAADLLELAEERDAVAAAEAGLRSLAVAHFQSTGAKNDVPGVAIKLIKEIDVDEDAAFVWAKEKQLAILPERLDLPAIEQMAKVMPLPFVTIREVPRADLSKDLDKALAAVVENHPVGAVAAASSSLGDF